MKYDQKFMYSCAFQLSCLQNNASTHTLNLHCHNPTSQLTNPNPKPQVLDSYQLAECMKKVLSKDNLPLAP